MYIFNRTKYIIAINHAELAGAITLTPYSSIPFAWMKTEDEPYIEIICDNKTLPLHGMRKKSRLKYRLGSLHVDVCCSEETIYVNILDVPLCPLSMLQKSIAHKIIKNSAEIHRMSVGQMSAVIQA
jgi:hypothetical protein